MARHLNSIVLLTLFATIFADEGKMFCPETEICCKGIVHPLLPYETHYTYCCGNVTIVWEWDQFHNDEEFLPPKCCEEVVYNVLVAGMYCCGSALINPATQMCVNEKVVEWSKDDQEAGRTVPCGDKFYNPTNESCCPEGTVVLKNDNQLCCKDVLYDPSMDLCCEGTLYVLEGALTYVQCCGAVRFHNQYDFCYTNWIYNEKTNSYNVHETVVSLEGRDPSQTYTLCGNQVMNTKNYVCCGSSIKPFGTNYYVICCGESLIDYNKYLCVNDEVVLKESDDHSVCGNQTYYDTKQCCYNDEVFELEEYRKCCFETTYDVYSQGCSDINRKVYNISDPDIDNGRTAYCEREQ